MTDPDLRARLLAAARAVDDLDDRAYARLSKWTYREAVVGPAGYLSDFATYLRHGDLRDADLRDLEAAIVEARGPE